MTRTPGRPPGGAFKTPAELEGRKTWASIALPAVTTLAEDEMLRSAMLALRSSIAQGSRDGAIHTVTHARVSGGFWWPRDLSELGDPSRWRVARFDGSIDAMLLGPDGVDRMETFPDIDAGPFWSVIRPWHDGIVERVLASETPCAPQRTAAITISANFDADTIEAGLDCSLGNHVIRRPLGLADEYAERDL